LRPGLVLLALVAAACAVAAHHSAGSAQEAEVTIPALWMPWEGGSVWRYSYGPHSGSANAAEALDFQPLDSAGKQCEAFTSAFWAVAVADGRAIALPNAVEIDHGGGFRTGYFHMADKQVNTGDEVKAGQRLGRPGCCPDGGVPNSCWSTDPHLHFYTVANGVRRPIAGTSIGGWVVGEGGCLDKGGAQACPGASLISNTPRSENAAPPPPLDITVALDISGSMRNAAEVGDMLRMLLPYLEEASRGVSVTLIGFNSHAQVLVGPRGPQPLSELMAAIGTLSPDGNTDLNSGLALSCREMKARGTAIRQALVLITDGVHNGGRLHEPHRCFADNGWPVFAYGVGRVNAPLLARLSATTGGDFRLAANVFDTACEMARIRTIMNGSAPTRCSRYLLHPGESLSVPLLVPPEQSQLALNVTWLPLGKAEGEPSLRTVLRTPDGGGFASEAALSHQQEATAERFAIGAPAAGQWEAIISGQSLSPAGALLTVEFGTNPIAQVMSTPTPTPSATEAAQPESETIDVAPEDTLTPPPEPTLEPDPTPTPAPTQRPRKTPPPTPSPPPPEPSPTP
jgi:hypothetical protein